MAVLTKTLMNRIGVIPTVETSAEPSSDTVTNFQGDLLFRLENTGASQRTITFTADRADNDGNTVDAQVVLEAGEVKYAGPFKDRARWGGGDHTLTIDYSGGTGAEVSIETVRFPFQATEAATKG